MEFRNIPARIKSFFGFGAEGSNRGPFFGQDTFGGWHQIEPLGDGWQRNLLRGDNQTTAADWAAINLHADAVSMMAVGHFERLPGGGLVAIKNSAASRVLRNPNAYQSHSEFWDVGVRQLLRTGNAVAAATLNARGEINSLHWCAAHSVHVDPATGAMFYGVNFSTASGQQFAPEALVPARQILHLRINATVGDPMRGVSNLVACAHSRAVNATLSNFLVSYLNNRASPSYGLATEAPLTAVQMNQLRQAWNEQSKQLASGGTPILSSGLKPVPLGAPPGDQLLADTFRLSVEDIARAHRIPKSLLALDETASNAENLMSLWLSVGLGSFITNIESSLDRLFGLPADETIQFDEDSLLRMDYAKRTEAISRLTTSGVMAIDESRAMMNLPPVEGGFGAMPTQQQQQIPISLLAELHAAQIANRLPQTPPATPAAAAKNAFRAARH